MILKNVNLHKVLSDTYLIVLIYCCYQSIYSNVS